MIYFDEEGTKYIVINNSVDAETGVPTIIYKQLEYNGKYPYSTVFTSTLTHFHKIMRNTP